MNTLAGTKFHGSTYDPAEDEKRFTSQLERVLALLSDGKQYNSDEICEGAAVSFSALRNRVSELRVYHGYVIESKRQKGGLFSYKLIRKMEPEELAKFVAELRKPKPVGNPELWGKMFEAIYANAAVNDIVTLADLSAAATAWAKDMSHAIYIKNKSI